MSDEENKKEEAPAKVEQNGVARPKAGTKTGRVWEIADGISATNEAPAKRKEVVEAAVKEGINSSTAATQYGRWRKFNGLGKEVKEEPPAADPAGEAEPAAE